MTQRIATLLNGIRVATFSNPKLKSAFVGVYVRTGGRNETTKNNGISHFLEHMAFKGTTTRTAREIAVIGERLGADMNAYTSKKETAYHLSGMAEHAPVFIDLLADMIQNNSLPEEELERERGVIVQEYHEYADDVDSIARRLLEKTCWGKHPLGMDVLGPLKNIKAFTRDDLKNYMQSQYTGSNIIVGVSGGIDHDDIVRRVEEAFGEMPMGTPHKVKAPKWDGGGRGKKHAGYSQSSLRIAFPTDVLDGPNYYADLMAGHVLGYGFSSPLFDEIREKRGLAYSVHSYSTIAADHGKMVIAASTTPENLTPFFDATADVLNTLATKVEPIDMERSANMLCVEQIQRFESSTDMMEAMVEDLFVLGRVRDPQEFYDGIHSVTADQVRDSFVRMLAAPAALSLAGSGADSEHYDAFIARLK